MKKQFGYGTGGLALEKPVILNTATVQKILADFLSGLILLDKGKPYTYDDILWVRETWVLLNVTPEGRIGYLNYYYKADVPDRRPPRWKLRYKSPMSMPREGARIFLRPTNIIHKRLRDITAEELAMCDYNVSPDNIRQEFGINIWNKQLSENEYPIYRWQANPWIYIIQFERITKLIHVKGNYYIPE